MTTTTRCASWKVVRVLLACLLAVCGAPTAAEAYCVGLDTSLPNYEPHYYSIRHEFDRSTYVVEARVKREIWIGEDGKERPLEPPFLNGASTPHGFDPYLGAFYVVDVLQVFKGDPKPELRLFSENSSGRFPMIVGRDYLLFVTDDVFDAPIGRQKAIDSCGNSGPLPTAQAALEAVEALLREK